MASNDGGGAESRLAEAIRGQLLSLLLPGSLLTSSAFYFGWVYVRALYAQYGIDPSVVGLSLTDYVLRSMNVLVPAAGRAAVAVLVATICFAAAARVVAHLRDRTRRRLRPAAVVIASGGLLVPWRRWFGATAVTSSLLRLVLVVIGIVGVYLCHQARSVRIERDQPASGPRRIANVLVRACFVLLVVDMTFELVRAQATSVGIAAGARNQAVVARSLTDPANPAKAAIDFPYVVLYSPAPLHLADHTYGVNVSLVPDDTGKTIYRTCGLRLFIRSDGHLLVWPTWRSMAEGMLRLQDGDGLRVELIRDGTAAARDHCPAA